MSDIAIRVENLGKQYRIGGPQARYKTLRESLVEVAQAPIRRLSSVARGQSSTIAGETIWALKDVSFEVNRGEVVGIIGRNGAGKTTLLKILSRITEPTEGWADIYGRVGSLLEVGTGFHPELTGRENIYLNGAILGMKRVEIDRKFDEIVAFSEIEKFLDTPVKHYSSGMYVRLAFAVAAHLEPEILLVDEVLAVGDAAFQKKCLGKMGEVAREGRTIMFVSHNMVAVESLCERSILVDRGRVVEEGDTTQIVKGYLSSLSQPLAAVVWADCESAPGNDVVRFRSFRLVVDQGKSTHLITVRTPILLEIDFWNLVPNADLHMNVQLLNALGVVVFASAPVHQPGYSSKRLPSGAYRSRCRIPGDLLNTGHYYVRLSAVRDGRIAYEHPVMLSFEVADSAERHGTAYGRAQGVVRPLLSWSTEAIDDTASIPHPRGAK